MQLYFWYANDIHFCYDSIPFGQSIRRTLILFNHAILIHALKKTLFPYEFPQKYQRKHQLFTVKRTLYTLFSEILFVICVFFSNFAFLPRVFFPSTLDLFS